MVVQSMNFEFIACNFCFVQHVLSGLFILFILLLLWHSLMPKCFLLTVVGIIIPLELLLKKLLVKKNGNWS